MRSNQQRLRNESPVTFGKAIDWQRVHVVSYKRRGGTATSNGAITMMNIPNNPDNPRPVPRGLSPIRTIPSADIYIYTPSSIPVFCRCFYTLYTACFNFELLCAGTSSRIPISFKALIEILKLIVYPGESLALQGYKRSTRELGPGSTRQDETSSSMIPAGEYLC